MNRMAFLGITAAMLLLATTLPAVSASRQPVETVSSVDLERYMGKWYEIASIPMFFQRKCAGNTTAEYTLQPDGLVKVLNSCETADHKRIRAEGRAKVVDKTTFAKLKVTFLHFLGWRFLAGGDYWIIGLDPEDYSYALVGHPTRKYGWILSRSPGLEMTHLQELARQLARQGYDTCRFMMTVQANGNQTRQPLCKVVQ